MGEVSRREMRKARRRDERSDVVCGQRGPSAVVGGAAAGCAGRWCDVCGMDGELAGVWTRRCSGAGVGLAGVGGAHLAWRRNAWVWDGVVDGAAGAGVGASGGVAAGFGRVVARGWRWLGVGYAGETKHGFADGGSAGAIAEGGCGSSGRGGSAGGFHGSCSVISGNGRIRDDTSGNDGCSGDKSGGNDGGVRRAEPSEETASSAVPAKVACGAGSIEIMSF